MGKVFLVGAGPGSADLITVRGARIMATAEIVFYDALVEPETLALAPNARHVAVGKRCSRVSTEQLFINRALVEAAHNHAVVVRLKGGDPMLFGRAQEEIDALAAAGVEYEVVPGITAALAASAEMGVSLTCRGVSRSVSFATARIGDGEAPGEWAYSAAESDTTVLYMAAGQAAGVARALIARGKARHTPAVIIENASRPNRRQTVTSLDHLERHGAERGEGPALLCIGEVYRRLAAVQGATFERRYANSARS